ncbi:MAG: sodium:solute symporter [Cryomorphaceae bacterium]|nr:sodium:solute symporter [Cryomorphaceae bacterium]
MIPILIITLYFLVLILISKLTTGKGDNSTFFTANRQSPWYLVAFGMIGASLSGVTFISVPGWVEGKQFSYMQMVFGYMLGYFIIANVLLPLYYRLNLVSIYGYLKKRYGPNAYLTGSSFFLLSRMLGSAFRLYIVALVLQILVFDAMGLPFWVAVVTTIGLIWLYTRKGGIATIIYTDTLQTLFMLLALGFSFYYLHQMIQPEQGFISYIQTHPWSKTFFWDDFGLDSRHFIKQFTGGMFIAIAMTGLDQDMMQKNLTCRNLGDARKNMFWFALCLLPVNLLFLMLGIYLYDYAAIAGLSASGDSLFAAVAFSENMPVWIGVVFLLGLVAAAYSSADSALAAMTTSFCVDILQMKNTESAKSVTTRKRIHILISVVLALFVILFRYVVSENVIQEIFTVATFTYGPLLGLYAFGLFTKLEVNDKYIPIAAIAAPLISLLFYFKGEQWLGYNFSFELLPLNGGLMFLGLLLLSKRKTHL